MNFLKQAASLSKEGNTSDLFKQAEGLFNSSGTQEDAPPAAPQHSATPQAPPAAPGDATATAKQTDIYGSAQILYQGIQDKLSGKNDVDDQQLASAAENVLQAANSSGFLGKDSQYSDYFNKAETYLHNYGSKSASNPPVPAPEDPAS